MLRPVDIEEILNNHPHINKKQLAEALELLAELQKQGVNSLRPRISSPFDRRRARLLDDLSNDPRVVRLRSK